MATPNKIPTRITAAVETPIRVPVFNDDAFEELLEEGDDPEVGVLDAPPFGELGLLVVV
jgi:hypothetical protein